MLEWVDAECTAAVARVMRTVDRKLHFEARSRGQKRRFAEKPAVARPRSVTAKPAGTWSK